MVIERVSPEIDGGLFPVKRVVGEKVEVHADIFADGHDQVKAVLLYRRKGENKWNETPMKYVVNDRWQGEFKVDQMGTLDYTLQGWVDHFQTWQEDLEKKIKAGLDVSVDMETGAQYLEREAQSRKTHDSEKLQFWAKKLRDEKDKESTYSLALSSELTEMMDKKPPPECLTTYHKQLSVWVDRKKALFSSWYEVFPRSCSPEPGKHGTFQDCIKLLPEISGMGFDVFYFPPIHPIGQTHRKGKNNSPTRNPQDPGSPWAIGSSEGGHKSVHPQLGEMKDFVNLIEEARKNGMEVALDLAFHCSPDHPYVQKHPEWFRWRPDGSVQFAENPPKKYEDIIPLNFETSSWKELWEELKSVVLFWVDKGIRMFRVDNPHTKSFAFWEWLIQEIKEDYPDVLFLSEAFTRPKVMYRLAKLGFSQSYTYFTWRNSKRELMDYMREITRTEVGEHFRPNFWPNTPDILPEFLQYGGRPAFIVRLILAATLSSNYGIYGPAYELCANQALPQKEEYKDSEKYEIKNWDRNSSQNLKNLITRVNQIRRENKALQTTRNLRFYETDNDQLLFYGKATDDFSNILFIVVNLDPFHTQSGWVQVPLQELGIAPEQPFLVYDLLSEDKYFWQGERNYIELNPHTMPVHVFRVHRRLRKEEDFDYFM